MRWVCSEAVKFLYNEKVVAMDSDIVVSHAAALDVYKKTITATVITPAITETRSYGVATPELLELVDWMDARNITHVAVEASGVYWKPVVNLLEAYDYTSIILIAPQHLTALPQRDPDIPPSQWIASLLRQGALNHHLPPRPKRELQEVVQYRMSMAHERAQEAQIIQKILAESARSVATDVIARIFTDHKRIIQALAHGESSPRKLADLGESSLKVPRETLISALSVLVEARRHAMLSVRLQHLAFLDLQIETLDQEITQRLKLF